MHSDNIPQGYARVTEILKVFTDFSGIPEGVLANAADRGGRVHDYCEAHALNLFLGEIDEDCKNYVEVFKQWFDSRVEKVICAEKRLNSPTYKISGKFDLLCILKGDNGLSLVDYKTPATESLTWELQTAAYEILTEECLGLKVQRRICLQLPKTGNNVRVIEHTKREENRRIFLNAVELFWFFNKR
jgi:hypothetical protein